jgi:hypothetical protein
MGHIVINSVPDPQEPRRGPPIEGENEALACVPFVPWRCPVCGSTKPRTYGQRGRVRFHECCGGRFRSVELTPEQLRDPEAMKGIF